MIRTTGADHWHSPRPLTPWQREQRDGAFGETPAVDLRGMVVAGLLSVAIFATGYVALWVLP